MNCGQEKVASYVKASLGGAGIVLMEPSIDMDSSATPFHNNPKAKSILEDIYKKKNLSIISGIKNEALLLKTANGFRDVKVNISHPQNMPSISVYEITGSSENIYKVLDFMSWQDGGSPEDIETYERHKKTFIARITSEFMMLKHQSDRNEYFGPIDITKQQN